MNHSITSWKWSSLTAVIYWHTLILKHFHFLFCITFPLSTSGKDLTDYKHCQILAVKERCDENRWSLCLSIRFKGFIPIWKKLWSTEWPSTLSGTWGTHGPYCPCPQSRTPFWGPSVPASGRPLGIGLQLPTALPGQAMGPSKPGLSMADVLVPVPKEVPCFLVAAGQKNLHTGSSGGFPMDHIPQDALCSQDTMLHTIQLSFRLQIKQQKSYKETSSFHHRSKCGG